jgi:phage baseplate assembly protein V
MLPRINDVVQCLHPTGDLTNGVCMGANYTTNNAGPSTSSMNSMCMLMDDGTLFEYDPDAKNWIITAQGTWNATFKGNINLTTQGNANIVVSGTAVIQATTIDLQGNVNISGDLTVSGFSNLQGGGEATPNMINQDGSGDGS